MQPKARRDVANFMSTSDNAPHVILVVDDEALLRMHATDLLEDAGYQVIEAPNAAAALDILEARSDVRLLFTDIQMPPGCDGIDLAKQVHERWPKVLLLVTSSGPNIADDDIPDAGRFLSKPYDQDMVKKVDSLIASAPKRSV